MPNHMVYKKMRFDLEQLGQLAILGLEKVKEDFAKGIVHTLGQNPTPQELAREISCLEVIRQEHGEDEFPSDLPADKFQDQWQRNLCRRTDGVKEWWKD